MSQIEIPPRSAGLRRPEVLAGVAAALLAGCLGVYLLIIRAQDDGGPAWYFVLLMLVAIALPVLFAAGLLGRRSLIVAAGLTAVLELLGLLSIGLLLTPALILLVIAAGTAPPTAGRP